LSERGGFLHAEGNDGASIAFVVIIAIKGEDRAYQCGYAQALEHVHNDLERRRKG